MQDDLLDYNLVVVGKTGSGKSWVCNRLLGSQDCHAPFRVYEGMEGRTTKAQRAEVTSRKNRRLHVIDTPDMFNLGGDDAGAELTFREWEKLIVSPGPIAFLFVFRLDLRFTPNDYELYKRYRKLLPRHLRNNIILGFTRVDDLPGPVKYEITLSDVKTMLNDCQQRHVTFNVPIAEQRGDREQVEQIQDEIMDWMTKMPSKMSWFDRGLAAMRSGVSELSRGTLGHFITSSRRTIGVSPSRCALCVICVATFVIFLRFFISTRREAI